MTPDPLLSVKIAAKRLHRNADTIRRYIRLGKLRAIRTPGGKRGGNYMIPESEVEKILQSSSAMSR